MILHQRCCDIIFDIKVSVHDLPHGLASLTHACMDVLVLLRELASVDALGGGVDQVEHSQEGVGEHLADRGPGRAHQGQVLPEDVVFGEAPVSVPEVSHLLQVLQVPQGCQRIGQ